MTDTASAQLRRILHVIPELGDGEPHSVAEIARKIGVDRNVLVRDIRTISERFDTPGGFIEGLTIYLEADTVEVHTNHFLRPMRLTRPELLALELGLAMLQNERPPEEQTGIERARHRLEQVLAGTPDHESDYRFASLTQGGDPEHFRRLQQASRARRRVRLSYRKSGADEASSRMLCPYGIVFASGMGYIVADCGKEGLRFFRLDRVEDVEVLDERYERPRDFSLEAVVREGRAFHSADAATLKVRYSPKVARWVAEREGKSVEADGSLVLEHPMADPEWAVRHVLQYGPDATVLEPAAVREEIVRRLEAMGPRPGVRESP
ncbi:MAG TPA: WYL domain-containing protein [Gemmatimonadales bacterium]|nr:WYL domain-containing protein [Gemmatimonadales bacterium]